MDTAPLAAPVFPRGSSPIVDHIHITRIVGLTQHGRHEIGLTFVDSPLRDNRDAYKTGGYMIFPFIMAEAEHTFADGRPQQFGRRSDNYRICHIELRTGGILRRCGIVEGFMDGRVKSFAAFIPHFSFLLPAECTGRARHFVKAVAHQAVVNKIH